MLYPHRSHPFGHFMNHFERDFFRQEPFFKEDASVNIYEDDNSFTVLMKSVGLKKEDINLHCDGKSLVIEWKRALEFNDQDNDTKVIVQELNPSETVRRQISFPHPIDDEAIDATYTNGVLKIVLNKKEKTEPKKIMVS